MKKLVKGFTLIELLIVIAIVAILAAVTFVALDPLSRFQDARDARRWSDIDAIISAIKLDQVDNGGSYHANITALTAGTEYMVRSAAAVDPTGVCGFAANNTVLVDFLETEGYLGAIPVAPQAPGGTAWADGRTGYTVTRLATGAITVTACDNEGGTDIEITR